MHTAQSGQEDVRDCHDRSFTPGQFETRGYCWGRERYAAQLPIEDNGSYCCLAWWSRAAGQAWSGSLTADSSGGKAAGWQGGLMAKKWPGRGCSDGKAAGWQGGRMAKKRHGLGRAGWEWSRALMTVRSAGHGLGRAGWEWSRALMTVRSAGHGLGRAGWEWSRAWMIVRSAGQGKGATHKRGAGGRFRLAKGRVADCAEMKRAMGREAHGSFLWKTEVFLEG